MVLASRSVDLEISKKLKNGNAFGKKLQKCRNISILESLKDDYKQIHKSHSRRYIELKSSFQRNTNQLLLTELALCGCAQYNDISKDRLEKDKKQHNEESNSAMASFEKNGNLLVDCGLLLKIENKSQTCTHVSTYSMREYVKYLENCTTCTPVRFVSLKGPETRASITRPTVTVTNGCSSLNQLAQTTEQRQLNHFLGFPATIAIIIKQSTKKRQHFSLSVLGSYMAISKFIDTPCSRSQAVTDIATSTNSQRDVSTPRTQFDDDPRGEDP
ncbi:hypothetical protein WN51_06316 [Melipona quadrifasciata]|uniref:Uncharacterized protein n=1 Tax=Melipona quadrifasciata TaxID=166423 RepID=A0A0M8ZT86_9HYME|nr:hypothetical protein WN51_06316 [Melipona quadrifasciata]